jgi:hypothetical protein
VRVGEVRVPSTSYSKTYKTYSRDRSNGDASGGTVVAADASADRARSPQFTDTTTAEMLSELPFRHASRTNPRAIVCSECLRARERTRRAGTKATLESAQGGGGCLAATELTWMRSQNTDEKAQTSASARFARTGPPPRCSARPTHRPRRG